MKVLHVINSFEGGGAEKLTLQLHEAYLNHGIDSHALSLMKSSAGNLAKTFSLGFNNPYKISASLKLYSFLSQPQWVNLDIVHVHLFPSQIFISLLSKILKVNAKFVTTEHNTFNYRRKIIGGKILDRIMYDCYTKIVCISPSTSKNLLYWQPQIASKLVVIYNGIDLNKYLDLSISSRRENPIIVSVGRLVEQKNYAPAIRALSKIAKLNFEYWIVGSGPLESQLKNLVNDLNLENKVRFLGFRKDVPDILSQADIFLQTSLWEGFGLAVVEAMAAGLPVIVSDVPGVREVVNIKSNSGFFVNPLSEEDIAEKVNKLLSSQSLRQTMRTNAQIVAAEFDINKTVKKYIDLYRVLCQETT